MDNRQATITLARLLPRLEAQFAAGADPADWQIFVSRLKTHFPRLFGLLLHLYGSQYDFYWHLEVILATAARRWLERSREQKALDAQREADPTWYQTQTMMAGVCYVDLFAGNLDGVCRQIPYFKELGLTCLHLMPLFAAPAGNSDGGYAVSSYREVNPSLGTMAQLAELAGELRHNGMSLILDFVFNHTSDEHEWAKKALAGDPDYQAFYFMFPDRQMPDAYQRTLREIFPEQRPGSFTWRPDAERWVWTTFNSFQWDLNYSNPAVFNAMLDEMLFLANQGVDVLRLDALAFIWKQMGTRCESLPEAHKVVQAYNALARIAAPSLLFLSEAIVHPDEVARYIHPDECQLSYNPLLMALLWNSLATREVRLLRDALERRFQIDPRCAWLNYVRVHDDIGWTFDDADAARLGINGFDHRRFLNAFFTGRFPGSFARGLPFQENPRTGDARVSGTCASLVGLEKALHAETSVEIDLAIRRILLIHSVILSIGGIPLIYLGDEIGTLNDYTYRDDPAKAGDSRWVHRPFANRQAIARRLEADTIEGRIYGQLHRLIALRQACTAFAGHEMQVINPESPHLLGYVRSQGTWRVLVLTNFSERQQIVLSNTVRLYGLAYSYTDLVSGRTITLEDNLTLEPFQFVWLVAQ